MFLTFVVKTVSPIRVRYTLRAINIAIVVYTLAVMIEATMVMTPCQSIVFYRVSIRFVQYP